VVNVGLLVAAAGISWLCATLWRAQRGQVGGRVTAPGDPLSAGRS
jgi:hypothetical protein